MITNKQSIATQLFKVIFGLYLIVTIIVTAIQMVSEYNHVTDTVQAEVKQLPETFLPGLSQALWTYNEKAIRSSLIGMHEVNTVSGVKIDTDTTSYHIGRVGVSDDKQAVYDSKGDLQKIKDNKIKNRLTPHQFKIEYMGDDGKNVLLGTGTIYSGNEIIFSRVEHGFMLIIVNSVIKTAALWLIFLYFIHKLLSKPLLKLANDTENIDINQASKAAISVDTDKDNELKTLETSFNRLLDRILQTKNEIEVLNLNLEEEVKQRTATLQNEVETRKKAQKNAEKANQLKNHFISNISHEIRTPMTSIYGMARFLQRSELNDEQSNYTDVLVRNCENLMRIIEEILDFASIEQGIVKIENHTFNLHDCVASSLRLFTLQCKTKDIVLSSSYDDNVPDQIHSDKTRIQQILTNLLNNAMKFTKEGEISLNVSMLHTDHEDSILFSITDTGIGISQEKFALIFDSFSQGDTSSTREYGGTGLGLTICKHYIDLLGGHIWLESKPGQGSTFYFTLPSSVLPEHQAIA